MTSEVTVTADIPDLAGHVTVVVAPPTVGRVDVAVEPPDTAGGVQVLVEPPDTAGQVDAEFPDVAGNVTLEAGVLVVGAGGGVRYGLPRLYPVAVDGTATVVTVHTSEGDFGPISVAGFVGSRALVDGALAYTITAAPAPWTPLALNAGDLITLYLENGLLAIGTNEAGPDSGPDLGAPATEVFVLDGSDGGPPDAAHTLFDNTTAQLPDPDPDADPPVPPADVQRAIESLKSLFDLLFARMEALEPHGRPVNDDFAVDESDANGIITIDGFLNDVTGTADPSLIPQFQTVTFARTDPSEFDVFIDGNFDGDPNGIHLDAIGHGTFNSKRYYADGLNWRSA